MEELYDGFIGELDKKDDFDNALIGYLNAIRYIAKIDADNINKGEINEQIGIIVDFVDEYSKTHYEISKIKGFKLKDSNYNEGQYYYYLADQKAKALVYYTRYLNFLNNIENYEESDVQKKFFEFLDTPEAEEKYSRADIEYFNKVRKDNRRKVDLIKAENQQKYFMFNNTMREIEFYGASFEFLWEWNTSNKTIFSAKPLYRKLNFTGGEREFEGKCKDWSAVSTNEKYIKNMFSETVSHLNDSKCLHSFTENGLLDVFKYLYPYKVTIADVKKSDKHKGYYDINPNNPNKPKYQAEFRIIKNANINNIFGDLGDKKNTSFQEFIEMENIQPYKDLGFTLEIYPPPKAGDETNEKDTEINIKDKLKNHLQLWGVDVSRIMSYVADDKEVISTGKCFTKAIRLTDNNEDNLVKVVENDYVCYEEKNKINLNDLNDVEIEKLFDTAEDGTLFSMSLTVNDMIYLLLKIYEIKLNSKFNKGVDIINVDIINKEQFNDENCFEYSINEKKYTIRFLFENNDTLEDFVNKKNKEYRDILTTGSPKSDFILTTLNLAPEDFEFVSKYNQYRNGDNEDVYKDIIMLKQIIFKM